MKKSKKKLSKTGRIFLDVILIVAICVAGYSGYQLYAGLKDYNDGKKEYESLAPEVVRNRTGSDENEVSIDWDQLKKINPDTAAWIHLDDSSIDYPVVYATDNSFYLTHLFDGTENRSGCVFIDYNNSHGFTDLNTVMYAHHMKNGTMFADVENYKDSSYYATHKEFHIYTPEGNYTMYPLGGYVTTGSDDYVRYTFTDDQEYLSYVNSFIEKSTIKSDETIEATDRTLMLSTCSYDVNDGRYVLIGKLVKDADQ